MSEKPEMLPGSVLVVDDDSGLLAAVAKSLRSAGIDHVETAEDGASAWDLLKKCNFGALVIDWKMAPVNGAQLLHRIRSRKESQDTPVLVMSGYLSRADFRFAEEYLFITLLEKPFDTRFLIRKVKELLKDRRWFDGERARIEEIVSSFPSGAKGAVPTLLNILDRAPRPVPITLAIARAIIDKGDTASAVLILRKLLDRDPECVVALTMLGKILLKQKKFDEAEEILAHAQKLSPENPERLCMLGDAALNNYDIEKAEDLFAAALSLDPEYDRAIAGAALTKNVGSYLAEFDPSKMPPSFASLLNAIGVSLVRRKKFAEGIQHYMSAMQYVDLDTHGPQLSFNLGLGYVKSADYLAAGTWLKKSLSYSDGNFTKAALLLEKLERLQLVPVSSSVLEGEDSDDEESLLGLPRKTRDTEKPRSIAQGPLATAAQPRSPSATANDADFQSEIDQIFQAIATSAKVQPVPAAVVADKASNPAAVVADEASNPALTDGPEQAVAQYQDILRKTYLPDATLLKLVGAMRCRRSHDPYLGNAKGTRIVILLPKNSVPSLIAKLSYVDFLKLDIKVFTEIRRNWTAVWPQQIAA